MVKRPFSFFLAFKFVLFDLFFTSHLNRDKCVLLKDHNVVTPVRLNQQPLGLESSTLLLSQCAPCLAFKLNVSIDLLNPNFGDL